MRPLQYLALVSIAAIGCGPSSPSGAAVPLDAAAQPEAGVGDAAGDAAGGGSGEASTTGCTVTSTTVTCPMKTLAIDVGGGTTRNVDFQVPAGTPAGAGFRVAFMFQGSFFSAIHDFNATTSDPFGAYYQALLLKKLLDAGYAVLAPETRGNGSTYWDTNIPPCATAWAGCPDDVFMNAIFAAIAAGKFGPLDGARMYATGISSGGYMTSRMAVSYAGKFKSLAIQSASYATCASTCTVPTPLPSDHPPTLFLHGQADNIVPITTMYPYRDALMQEGHVVQTIIDPNAGHQWIAQAPDAVVAWFNASP